MQQKNIIIIICALVAIGCGTAVLLGVFPVKLFPVKSVPYPNGHVAIWVPLPATPENVTRYHVVPGANDTAYFSVNNLEQVRENATPVQDVPIVVPKALEPYGGLPGDAVMTYAETEYLEQHQLSNIPFIQPEIIAKYPISTDVFYGRKLGGIPVTGEGSYIKVILGNDGELLYLNKVWRTVEPDGTETVIPVTDAIEKLGRGEILNPSRYLGDISVNRIYLAYWEESAGVPQEYLDPVWVFAGTTSSGDAISCKVSARVGAGYPGIARTGSAGVLSIAESAVYDGPSQPRDNTADSTPSINGT